MFRDMHGFQRLSSFPAAHEISRKDCMARNIARLQRTCPNEFDFVPKSWLIPAEHGLLLSCNDDKKSKGQSKGARCYIVKPVNSAMGTHARTTTL